jgi:DNA-binding beta-propeller fold protein YncE
MDRRTFLMGLAAAPFALRPGGQGRALALVTADLESRLVALDARSGAVVAHVRTLPGPRSIETVAGGTTALVCHTQHGALSLVDAASLKVVHELGGFAEPRYTAAAPDGRHAYVTDAKLGQVVVVDAIRGRVAGRCEVGALARHVTIAPGGRTVWTALGPKAASIAVVDASDPTRPRLRRTVEPSFPAHDVDWDRTGRRVWVTSGAEDAIAIHDARSGRVLHRLPAGKPPQHVVVLDDAAYVASGDSASLRVHAASDGRLLHQSWVPVGSYNVTFGAGRICTPSLEAGTVVLADLRGVPRHRRRIARSAHDACIVALESSGS